MAAFSAVVSTSIALAADAQWGRLYILPSTVSVRENPSDTALQVRVLKAGQKVRVDFQDDGWAAVFDPKETKRSELRALGYVKLADLKGGQAAAEDIPASSIEVRKKGREDKVEQRAEAKPQKAEKKTAAKAPAKAAKAAAPKTFGEVRVADRSLSVRAERDKDSTLRRVLKAGQKVRVDMLENGWYAVFDPEEKERDLDRAWGFASAKYLVQESEYAGGAPAETPAKAQKPAKDDTVGYAVLSRKADHHKPPVMTLRVRLDLAHPPIQEAMRKIAREIWKAEHKDGENLQLELLLAGMDAKGLAYAVAKFHDDGRLREFWWRDVVLDKTGGK